MKQIIVAKSAGFCFGVKRAVDTVYEQAAYGFGTVDKYDYSINRISELTDIV